MIDKIAIILGTIYLLIYVTLLQFIEYYSIAFVLFTCSPLVVISMVFAVIKYGKYTGRELKENEEWGYGDKESDQLGTF